jgi:D-alanyl-D-alanine carboxypeptidase (penicillin-binding protein 5/6)
VTLVLALAPGAGAATRPKPPTPPASIDTGPAAAPGAPSAPPKAYVLVDADTGAVIDQANDHAPLPPASLTKVLTALTAMTHLSPTDSVPVSARAAGQEANDVGMVAGQTWSLTDTLHALLLVSGNDAAMALAERAGGSAEAFAVMMGTEAKALGFHDGDVFNDPAGLDDDYSVGGGNLVSARDLAIAARAIVADPTLGPIVATPRYSFKAPDGFVHNLTNHNKLLLGQYPGSIGVKTGFTRKSGRDLIAAARRNGRTMIAVLLGAGDTYGSAAKLLDKGFATPVATEPPADRLPGLGSVAPPAPAAVPQPAGHATNAAAADRSGSPAPVVSDVASRGRPAWALPVVAALLVVLTLGVRTRRRSRRRSRRRLQLGL